MLKVLVFNPEKARKVAFTGTVFVSTLFDITTTFIASLNAHLFTELNPLFSGLFESQEAGVLFVIPVMMTALFWYSYDWLCKKGFKTHTETIMILYVMSSILAGINNIIELSHIVG